jgi:hypothetical protein
MFLSYRRLTSQPASQISPSPAPTLDAEKA